MQKYCKNCSRENPPDASFCRNCAAPLSPNQPVGGQNNPPFNQANFANQPVNTSGGASTRAIVSLVLVITSLFCCVFTSIPGAILGWMEIGAIKRGESSPSGMMMAQIGLWGGIIMTVLSVIGGFLYLLLAAASMNSNPYGY